jgi:hypothetical protein
MSVRHCLKLLSVSLNTLKPRFLLFVIKAEFAALLFTDFINKRRRMRSLPISAMVL